MSRERFERIERYGAQVIKTPGVESNVKEIYDKTWELRRDPQIRILNQFEVMGNYRFHYTSPATRLSNSRMNLNSEAFAMVPLRLFVWRWAARGRFGRAGSG